MIWTPFKMVPKKFLGIDIGTSAIKLVEISRWQERRKLENYGEMPTVALYEKPFRTFGKSTLLLSSQDISKAILAILNEAKIKTRQVVFSIPDFSSFFTNFGLPSMTKEELSEAVMFEARQHVPLPLIEVTLDWQVIEGKIPEGKISNQKKTDLKILLIAVPNEVINQYQVIAQLCKLKLFALEAEVFGLIRSLIREEEGGVVVLVDIGAQSTTCNIIENRILKRSYSLDVSANELTKLISKGLNIDYREAEGLKRKYGLTTSERKIREILLPLIDLILIEIDKISKNFYQQESKEVQKIILAGGQALLPGLKEYFESHLKKEIEIANPFSNLLYPPILENTLKEIGPSYAIAVGMALRGLE